jgi:hypothetical protein
LRWSFGIRGGRIRALVTTTIITTITPTITIITTISITITTIISITIAIIAITIAIIRRFLLKRLHIIAYNRILITIIYPS